jgi:hypothetical protein
MNWLDIGQIIFIVLVVVVGIGWMAKVMFTDEKKSDE